MKALILTATIWYRLLAYRQTYKSLAAFSNRCCPSKSFITPVTLFSNLEGLQYTKTP
jgi:hypothetical protein